MEGLAVALMRGSLIVVVELCDMDGFSLWVIGWMIE